MPFLKPFGVEYIYIVRSDGIMIGSTATGQIMGPVKGHLTITKSKTLKGIQAHHPNYLFLSSDSTNAIWKIKYEDKNTPENQSLLEEKKDGLRELMFS
jgi:hypothetical protein